MPLAVIFDMDGLMLDTEPLSYRAWHDAARDLGCELGPDVFGGMIGRTLAANTRHLLDHYGPEYPAEALATAAVARYRALLDVHGVPVKPGLPELLRLLEARDVARAVATSTATELAREKLDRAGLLDRLTVVVGGDRVAHGKPAPDIFLEAARRLGHDPAECLVLEDSEPGILGAAAAGMRGVLVPDGRSPGHAASRAAYAVVPSLDAARRLIETLLARDGR